MAEIRRLYPLLKSRHLFTLKNAIYDKTQRGLTRTCTTAIEAEVDHVDNLTPSEQYQHVPVMVNEVFDILQPEDGQVWRIFRHLHI